MATVEDPSRWAKEDAAVPSAKMAYSDRSDRWKAEHRDWLMMELKRLASNWKSKPAGFFSADEQTDRVARARTSACAQELEAILLT